MEGEIVVAHGCRKRKKLICCTEGEIVVAHGRLPSTALLGTPNKFISNLARLTPDEVEKLELPVSEQEVSEAIKETKSGSVPAPDGLPHEFYKQFWCQS